MTLYSVNSHSAAFQEGEAAFHDEADFDDCPYDETTADCWNWQSGWEAAEYENSCIGNDDAYNDPRSGQSFPSGRWSSRNPDLY